jgi:UDP-3-O-[3-hydroxymyristoyl] glucosamine N-acyltransferase
MHEPMTLSEIALLVGGEVDGDSTIRILRVAPIEAAESGDITFLANAKYEKFLATTGASAVIVGQGQNVARAGLNVVRVADPFLSFTTVQKLFAPPAPFVPPGVHPTAVVAISAMLGDDVAIGPLCVLGEGVTIGPRTMVFPRVVLGNNVIIGADSTLYPGVTIYDGCRIGDRVTIHAGAVIGADGFGFAPNAEGAYDKIPQTGIVVIESDVEIGANSTVDRATLGQTIVHKGAKIDNLVMVGHNAEIGEDTLLIAQSGISGSSRLGRHVTVAGQAGVSGHVDLADNVVISAQSGVSKSLLRAGLYMGSPAREYHVALKTEALIRQLPELVRELRDLSARVAVLTTEPHTDPAQTKS